MLCSLNAKSKEICHGDDEKQKNAVRKLFQNQQEEFYSRGVLDISQRLTAADTRQGEFIGYQHCFGNKSIFKTIYHTHN